MSWRNILTHLIVFGTFARGHLPMKQPAFKNEPATIRFKENDTVFLPCLIDDIGGNNLRWWREEVLVFDSDKPHFPVPERMSVMADGLTIESVVAEDAGHYTCEVIRPQPWSPLRLTQRLEVMYPPRIFPVPASGYLEVVLGEKVGIGCSATGMPPPTILWRTKEIPMTSFGKNTEKVEFTASSRHFSGLYQCEANNGIGAPAYANIILQILHPPEVEVEKDRVHSGPRMKMTLKCRIVAVPQAKVSWYHDGILLKAIGPRVVQKNRGQDTVLLFNSVDVSDFGNYTCQGRNLLGAANRSILLTGTANAAVFKTVEMRLPDGFELVWEVDSFSPIFEYKLSFRTEDSVHWNSVIVPPDGASSGPLHSKSYFLSGLDRSVRYEARISSRNRFGWSESSDTIKFGFMKMGYVTERPSGSVSRSSSTFSDASTLFLRLLWILLLIFRLFQYIYGIS